MAFIDRYIFTVIANTVRGKNLSPRPMRLIPAELMQREEGLSAGFSYAALELLMFR